MGDRMDTRSVALIGLYALVAFFIYVWLAIPAGAGWDGMVHWGDVATWISAIGTLAAVIVALGIALSDARRRNLKDYARGRVLASYLFADIGIAETGVVAAEASLESVLTATSPAAMNQALADAIRAINVIDVSKIIGAMDKLSDLPPNHAIGLAAIPDNFKAVVTVLRGTWGKGSNVAAADAIATAEQCLEQLHITRRRLRAFLHEFEPEFVG
jgi:hypothetical protein